MDERSLRLFHRGYVQPLGPDAPHELVVPALDEAKIRPGYLGAFGMSEMEEAAREIVSICRDLGSWEVSFNMHVPSEKSAVGFASLAFARFVLPAYPNSRWRVTAACVDRVQSPTGWRHDDARNQWVLA